MNKKEELMFTCMSQVAALIVKHADGTYSGSECGNRLTKEQLREWYSKYYNPHNPKKRVIILEYHLYDPKKE